MKDNATVAPAIYEEEKNDINILNHKEYPALYSTKSFNSYDLAKTISTRPFKFLSIPP